ncbi:hypothetical protein FH063_003933 [Azospirillum argentinense]|uniref:Uncharacterized protein n=1 Tax=Azospirillum argentinense TaxID=2970906 RepID=A0A5B0KZY1_9PROT|nr:hypothetical protein FH063_003933 [Azospirillum argentinense]
MKGAGRQGQASEIARLKRELARVHMEQDIGARYIIADSR